MKISYYSKKMLSVIPSTQRTFQFFWVYFTKPIFISNVKDHYKYIQCFQIEHQLMVFVVFSSLHCVHLLLYLTCYECVCPLNKNTITTTLRLYGWCRIICLYIGKKFFTWQHTAFVIKRPFLYIFQIKRQDKL